VEGETGKKMLGLSLFVLKSMTSPITNKSRTERFGASTMPLTRPILSRLALFRVLGTPIKLINRMLVVAQSLMMSNGEDV